MMDITLPSCSQHSLSHNEPMYGTVKKRTDVWFLLEYNQPPGKEALDESGISFAVQEHLTAYPLSKTLLIRQPGLAGENDGKITLHVVVSGGENPRYYTLLLDDYEDVLSLDLDAIVSGNVSEPHMDLLYIVCTNGKRDACCAQFGVPLYNALARMVDKSVWQSSHIGGHRFAATMLVFPSGICYGRVNVADAAEVVASAQANRLLLEHYRGRGTFEQPVQAAEYFVRRVTGLDAIDALTVVALEKKDNTWNVTFEDSGGVEHRVRVQETKSPAPIRVSCGETPEYVPAFVRVE